MKRVIFVLLISFFIFSCDEKKTTTNYYPVKLDPISVEATKLTYIQISKRSIINSDAHDTLDIADISRTADKLFPDKYEYFKLSFDSVFSNPIHNKGYVRETKKYNTDKQLHYTDGYYVYIFSKLKQ